MKRLHTLVLCAILLLVYNGCAWAQEAPEVAARGAVLVDRASGRILYNHDMNEMLPMASTTKIMTALLAFENGNLDQMVTAGPNASGVTGTSIYLSEGEQLSMSDMLKGLMLQSGNDAAVAIAEHLGGSVENFAEMMNRRARELDADANFVTPNGLDAEGHGASALGMARIACAAMEIPEFRELVSTQRGTIPWVDHEYKRVLTNKNRLLKEYPGATGIKTGYTSKAGRCLVFSAERDGMELVGVVLNCGEWFDAAQRMLDWGFDTFKPVEVMQSGIQPLKADVKGGKTGQVAVRAQEGITIPVKVGDQYQLYYELPRNVAAPVSEGQWLGTAWVELNGEKLSEVDLVAAGSVDEGGFAHAFLRVLRSFFHIGI